MSELDRLGRLHGSTLKSAISKRQVPDLDGVPRSTSRARGPLVAIAAALLVLVVALPLLLTRGQPTDTTESDLAGSTPPTATTNPEEPVDTDAGWRFIEADFEMRENASYAIGDGLFLAWGGAPDRSGDLRSDGLIINIDSGTVTDVPDAPIAARYGAAAIKTPDEFILFGGYSFDQSFIDGASFDPNSMTWSTIAPSPLQPAANPSAVWTGSEMMVWLPSNDSEFASLPVPGQGQFAAYDPVENSWRLLDPPPGAFTDAVLLYQADRNRVVLVGGPPMRELGTISSGESMDFIAYDLESEEWAEHVDAWSPVTETARATLGPGDAITVLSSPDIYLVDDNRWNAVGPVHHCPSELDATSGGNYVYLKGLAGDTGDGCTVMRFEGTTDNLTQLLEPNAYGQTGSAFGSGFLADNEGRLITIGDADGPTAEGTSGQAVIGIYTP